MPRVLQVLGTVAICISAAMLGSCSEPTKAHAVPRADLVAQGAQPAFLACPNDSARSASAVVGPLGGTVALGNTSISIPAGALLQSTTITVTIPASRYVVVDITADGRSGLTFLEAATVTVDYARCPDSALPSTALSTWYVDDALTPLQFMAGVDLRARRRVVFVTGHLSGYAIAQ